MFQNDLLQDQTILITGGGTGLGRAMAERFAGLGADVGIFGRRREPLEETAAVLRDASALVPAEFRWHYYLGQAIRRTGDMETAATAFSEPSTWRTSASRRVARIRSTAIPSEASTR